MTAQALKERNETFLSRLAARREVRRLRQAKKKVPAELLAQAGIGTIEKQARARKVLWTVQTSHGPVSAFVARQEAATALGIKNRRWMNRAELDEAITLATEIVEGKKGDGSGFDMKETRLRQLEEIGRARCRAAWDAWKKKREQEKKD